MPAALQICRRQIIIRAALHVCSTAPLSDRHHMQHDTSASCCSGRTSLPRRFCVLPWACNFLIPTRVRGFSAGLEQNEAGKAATRWLYEYLYTVSRRCILWRPTLVWRTVSSLAKPSRSSGSLITCRTYHVTNTPNVTCNKEGRSAS